MNAIRMVQRCGEHQRAGLPVAPEALPPVILQWDGRCLTVEGQSYFAVYVWTHEALASAMIRLATESDEATDEEVAAVARMTEILAGRDLRRSFSIGSTGLVGTLLHLRLGRLAAMHEEFDGLMKRYRREQP